jgi:hypothetical protein
MHGQKELMKLLILLNLLLLAGSASALAQNVDGGSMRGGSDGISPTGANYSGYWALENEHLIVEDSYDQHGARVIWGCGQGGCMVLGSGSYTYDDSVLVTRSTVADPLGETLKAVLSVPFIGGHTLLNLPEGATVENLNHYLMNIPTVPKK